MRITLAVAAMLATTSLPAAAAVTFVNAITVAGGASDSSGGIGPNNSRLSFGSDLVYDAKADQYYGITDRGPGGGLIDYAPRVNVFKLDVDATTGAVSNYTQQSTVIFKGPDGKPYSGLMPSLLPGGTVAKLGNSLDSEGFVRRGNGNFLVSDEYGPSVIEFKPDGTFVRAFTTPANLIPKTAGGGVDYVNGRPTITTGRQDNRGFEGLTLSRDGKTAYAILQDPLVNEGSQGDGRRSRNLRIVSFDVATGMSNGQFLYRLENTDDINARLPVGATQFTATSQGRNIGVSAIYALKDGKFLVIERDNRGFGVADPTGTGDAVGSKRIYLIDINGATDITDVSFAGANSVPNGVTAVSKSLFLDVQAALQAAGVTVAEKFEGLTLGRDLDGGVSLLLATDNDFSVTQTGNGTQFDICSSGVGGTTSQVAFGAACPAGQSLIPTYVYAFKVTGADAASVAVPEPATWALMLTGFGLVGGAMRRRNAAAA